MLGIGRGCVGLWVVGLGVRFGVCIVLWRGFILWVEVARVDVVVRRRCGRFVSLFAEVLGFLVCMVVLACVWGFSRVWFLPKRAPSKRLLQRSWRRSLERVVFARRRCRKLSMTGTNRK